eukprot:TRINITY_DN34084_c0_g1_i3.p1 TRINITY_DN34084_c0_g1~~TRINITY_DN34084_c0_g1_i3.p1  ORF type:complete len:399 (+),score=77.30 TRINITY_DN34084_c0_g1_i3:92-1288(+)
MAALQVGTHSPWSRRACAALAVVLCAGRARAESVELGHDTRVVMGSHAQLAPVKALMRREGQELKLSGQGGLRHRADERDCFTARDVAAVSTSFRATREFWSMKCSSIDPEADILMLKMGNAIDFFRPVDGGDMCGMLNSTSKHLWCSSYDPHKWVRPAYASAGKGALGGSGSGAASSEGREFLSFWGSETSKGGCCSLGDVAPGGKPTTARWGLPFEMSSCRQCGLLAHVTGGEKLDKDFWDSDAGCQAIPDSATMIRITSGSAVDYFKPRELSAAEKGAYSGSLLEDSDKANASLWHGQKEALCAMLKSTQLHLWSGDGKNWKKPEYSTSASHLGGSADDWPKSNIPGDSRRFLTFWGSADFTGGCCSTSLRGECEGDLDKCFNKAIKIEYCRDPF